MFAVHDGAGTYVTPTPTFVLHDPLVPNGRVLVHHSDGQSHERLPDRHIAALAGHQHGVVARTQLIDLGMQRGAIELRLRRGRLHPVHRGVYSVGHDKLTREGRWMAAVLAGGPGAVLSHHAAAAHWGIRPSDRRVVDVTVGRALRGRTDLRFHRSHLPGDEVTIREGIPVTTVARTLFDLAGTVTLHQLRRAAHEAEIRRLWEALSLADLLARHPRHPGAASVRELIASPDAGITRGTFEERFLEFARARHLPRPATNVTFFAGDQWIEADCVWRSQRLMLELDDHTTHRTRFAYERDRARDRALVAAGWRVIRLTWRQLRDEPEAVVADLRASLARPPHR